MSKHTPGPWGYRFDDGSPRVVGQIDGEPTSVATVAICTSRCRTVEESRANAVLICAAPELLAALIALTTPPRDAAIATNYANARAAIAKATAA